MMIDKKYFSVERIVETDVWYIADVEIVEDIEIEVVFDDEEPFDRNKAWKEAVKYVTKKYGRGNFRTDKRRSRFILKK